MSLHVEVKIDVILHATENQEKIFDSLLENFDIKREISILLEKVDIEEEIVRIESHISKLKSIIKT